MTIQQVIALILIFMQHAIDVSKAYTNEQTGGGGDEDEHTISNGVFNVPEDGHSVLNGLFSIPTDNHIILNGVLNVL